MAGFVEEMPLTSRHVTVVFVDVAESVRLVAQAEWQAVHRIKGLLTKAASDTVPACGGAVVERQGDGMLLRFDHPRDAVRCATRLHQLAATASASPEQVASVPAMQLRVGLHFGSVLTDQRALYGAAVNLTARIAAMAMPGQTLLSAATIDLLTPGLDGEFDDLGPCYLKHVDEPVRLFRLRADALTLPATLNAAIAARMKLKPTLLVLPARRPGRAPRAGQPMDWADIVNDQLCRQFGQSPMLHVISALSANRLGHGAIDLSQLYRRWHADYVLEIQVLGQPGALDGVAEAALATVSLQVQLWRAGDGEPVHVEAVSGRANELLNGGSDLLGRIVHSVGLRILTVEQRAARATASLPNLASHTLYLNAVDLLHRVSAVDFDRARDMLLALHERAPRHSEPLAWLARWYVFKVMQGWTDNKQRDSQQALSFSARALDRDPASPLALTMAGSVHAGIQTDAKTAQGYYEQALLHNPNESLAWLMSGVAQGFLSAPAPALAASEMALGLAPLDPTRHFYDSLAATASLRAGEYERCIGLARRAVAGNATHGSSHRAMAIAQGLLGRWDDARATVSQLLAIEPQCTVALYLGRVGAMNAQSLRFAQVLQDAGLPEC